MNDTPNESRKVAFEEQMLHSFKRVTRAAFQTTLPILFCKIIFSQYNPLMKVPKKKFDLQGSFMFPDWAYITCTQSGLKKYHYYV
jgi:hypothetical protein